MAGDNEADPIELSDSPSPPASKRGAEPAAGAAGAAGRVASTTPPAAKRAKTAEAPPNPNNWLADLHAARLARRGSPPAADDSDSEEEEDELPPSNTRHVRLISFNVWFEDVAMAERFRAIGDIVAREEPDVVALQEVTPASLQMLLRHPRLSRYQSSVSVVDANAGRYGPYFVAMLLRLGDGESRGFAPLCTGRMKFPSSVMGRDLHSFTHESGITFGTTHLESPTPPDFRVPERRKQAGIAFKALDMLNRSVVLAGDLNWGERDGDLPMPVGWSDAWTELRPREAGFTYDGRKNGMLANSLQGRLDRVVSRLRDGWRYAEVRLIGTEPLAGLTYQRTFRNGFSKTLAVLPSDHFGLLVDFERDI